MVTHRRAGALAAVSLTLTLVLAAASSALAQASYGSPGGGSVEPSVDELEGQIVHWVGPQVAGLQQAARDLYLANRTRDIVMPFAPMRTDNCRMTKAVLV